MPRRPAETETTLAGDIALARRLAFLAKDIAAGRNVRALPSRTTAALKRAMTDVRVDLDETLDGDVAL